MTTYRLNLTRIYLQNANARSDELLAQRVGKAAHGSFRSAVDATAGVGFPTRDAANVDDVSRATVGPLEEDGQDGLGHVNQASDIGREHDVHVLLSDLRRFGYAFD
jgi:hypothetical protein